MERRSPVWRTYDHKRFPAQAARVFDGAGTGGETAARDMHGNIDQAAIDAGGVCTQIIKERELSQICADNHYVSAHLFRRLGDIPEFAKY